MTLARALLVRADLRNARMGPLRNVGNRSLDLCTNGENANFGGADLRGADLCGARLLGADFANADLRGADLTGAKYEEPRLRGALREGAQGHAA